MSLPNYKLINIVDPVQYNLISFKDNKNKISYTDCFEISLLRFLHAVFLKKDENSFKIDIDRMKCFMNINRFCKQIIQFFTNNPEIYLDKDYYENDGYTIRTKWCIFLNNRPFFRYKLQNKFEVCASLDNLITFFQVFFPKIYLDQPSFQDKLLTLASTLSTPDIKIDISLKSDCQRKCNRFFFTDLMTVSFNTIKLYDWLIYQYFENVYGIVKNRITGHSDLHYFDSDCDYGSSDSDSDYGSSDSDSDCGSSDGSDVEDDDCFEDEVDSDDQVDNLLDGSEYDLESKYINFF